MSLRSNNVGESSHSFPRRVSTVKLPQPEAVIESDPSSTSNHLNRTSGPQGPASPAPSPKSKQRSARSSGKMPQYTSRDVGDPSQIKKNKQSMADLKLRRLTELNNRLREDLERERIPVSQASKR